MDEDVCNKSLVTSYKFTIPWPCAVESLRATFVRKTYPRFQNVYEANQIHCVFSFIHAGAIFLVDRRRNLVPKVLSFSLLEVKISYQQD